MKISVIGTGYVGLVSAVGWSDLGHEVTCIDIDEEKLNKIKNGHSPIHEDGIEELLDKGVSEGRIKTDSSFSDIAESDIAIISVGTPPNEDGSMNDEFIRSCSASIGEEIKKSQKFNIIAVRSTVLPGTTDNTVKRIIEGKSGKKAGKDFGLVMIPEFLREGHAISDFKNPDRIIIGFEDERSKRILQEMHKPFNCPVLFTDIATAEMVKYASNAFLATKVAYTNEMARICEKIGVDIDRITEYIGMDKRIGREFLVAGAGFGGSCFPKDVKGLIKKANEMHTEPKILEAAMESNEIQKKHIVDMIKEKTGLKDRKIGILGLAFKADTDDVRESPATDIIKGLLDDGAVVRAYDPHAMKNMKKIISGIEYAASIDDCIKGCDAVVILEAWPQFMLGAKRYKEMLGDSILFDARRIFSDREAGEAGLRYVCIGRGEK